MPDLRFMLRRASSPASRPADVGTLWSAARRKARRARMLSVVAVVLVGAASASAIATLELVNLGIDDQPPAVSDAGASRPASPSEDANNPTGQADACSMDHVLCVRLDRPLSIVGAGFGTAWVGNIGEGNTFGIARFAAETGEEIARLRTHGFIQGFAPDERWMWALLEANQTLTLLKIDPEDTEVIEQFDLGSSGNVGVPSIVSGGGYVWVSGQGGALTRVAAGEGGRETYSYAGALPGYSPDNGPLHLAYGEEQLWLSYGLGHVGVVDPESGQLVRVHEDALGMNAYNLTVAGGHLWSSHQSPRGDNVLSYAPTDGSESGRGRIELEQAIPGMAIAQGDARVWVVQVGFQEDDPGWLIDVDARNRERVGDALEVDLVLEGTVAYGDGYIWVTGNKVLYRITP